jgi:ATP-dependent Clp protease protease subunit
MSESSETPPKFILQHLFDARTILLCDGIEPESATRVCSQLLAMAAISDHPITMLINSPGGHVSAGDMIHDIIRAISPRVRMVGTGTVASAGALIYVAAEREDRVCLPNTRFLLHQPSSGIGGVADDVQIQADEILKMRERLNRIFAERTGQALDRIARDTHRDFWLSTEQAIEYGLVSRVINSLSELA